MGAIADLMRTMHAKGAAFDVIADAVEAMERPKRKPATCEKGTRLSKDWQLPRPWGNWALLELGLDADLIRREAGAFRDFWISKPGAGGTKLDWEATWRNWMRKAADRQRPAYNKPLSAVEQRRQNMKQRLSNDERFGGREGDDVPEVRGRLPVLTSH